jgi:phosphoglucosamine mutase
MRFCVFARIFFSIFAVGSVPKQKNRNKIILSKNMERTEIGMGKYFGTDGFRGEAGVTLTSEQAYAIGRFLGWHYRKKGTGRVKVVIGKDTRRSSYMVEYAVVAGLTASGADAYMLHVTTTPGVCYVVSREDFDCGIMISASHNPYFDNGIKLINGRGEKMEDALLELVERYLDGEREGLGIDGEISGVAGEELGRIVDYAAGRNRYIGYLISLSSHSFRPFRVGLDCANGSAWMIARSVFEALGAKVYAINADPDGLNINRNAGSTHIERLVEHVLENKLDVGFAFDGDADRCIAVDELGNVVNGDHILYILARQLKREGALFNNTVVTTVMSNLGLYRALEQDGISYVQTKVGDRFVYENMSQTGNCIGGEQSGHVILGKYATTGDGILTAIKVMDAVVGEKLPLSKLAEPVVMYPQVSESIRVKNKDAALKDSEVKQALRRAEERLGDGGRILLRASGTEPVIRVMAEAEREADCRRAVESIKQAIEGRF